MKAVIMAGGEGTRLHPVNNNCPKPMVRLLGRPVMEHLILLLRENGFDDICVTLKYMPDAIKSYFGNGRAFGVNIIYRLEDSPMGTAGGVGACRDFTASDDFLVVSGDAVCDFDLRSFMQAHLEGGHTLTMALYPHPEPLQYGLVLTGRDGKIAGFIEKPSWDRVVTDLVNTGIYAISPKALDMIPTGRKFDFARDLFPAMMDAGIQLHGLPMTGYWCDIGSPNAYLKCAMDALYGSLRLSPGITKKCVGSAEILSPSFVGPCADIGDGAVIGPGAYIAGVSRIAPGATVKSAIVDSADIGRGAAVENAVICRGATVPEGSAIKGGSVVAAPGSEPAPAVKSAPDSASRRRLPHRKVLPCPSGRAAVMRVLSEQLMESGADFSDGLSLSTPSGSVHIAPAGASQELVIEAETQTLAEEYGALAAGLL